MPDINFLCQQEHDCASNFSNLGNGTKGIEPGYFESTFYIKNTGKETLTGNWTIYYTQISDTSSPCSGRFADHDKQISQAIIN